MTMLPPVAFLIVAIAPKIGIAFSGDVCKKAGKNDEECRICRQ